MTSLSEVLHDRVMEKHPGLMRGNVIDQLFGVEFTTTCVSSVVGCCSLVFGLRTDHPHTGVRFLRRLTCGECEGEPPVIQKEIARKVVCNIEGGAGSTVQINHLTAGIELVGKKYCPRPLDPSFSACFVMLAWHLCGVFQGLGGKLGETVCHSWPKCGLVPAQQDFAFAKVPVCPADAVLLEAHS
jgi:hypothetical protein